jgi:hypothetical protein
VKVKKEILLTELVLTVPIFLTKLVSTVLIFLTEFVLAIPIFLTELGCTCTGISTGISY